MRLGAALVSLALLAGCSDLFPARKPEALPLPNLVAAPSSSVAALGTRTGPGPGTFVIDLPAAIELAGARASEVRIARVAADQARNRVYREWSALVPTFVPFFRAFDHVGQAQPQTGANVYVTRTNYEVQLVAFNLWNPGPLAYSILAARRRADAAEQRSEAARRDTVLAAALGYLELVRGRALLHVARESVRQAEEVVRIEESRERAGAGTRALTLRARSELADRRQDLAIAVEDEARAQAALAELLQLEAGTDLVPRESFPVPLALVRANEPIEDLVARAQTARPELAAAQEEVAAREHERGRALFGPLAPFAAGYLQTGVFGATLGKMRFSQDAFALVGWHLGPGGLLDVPAIQIASRNVHAQHLEVRRLRARVQLEVASASTAIVEGERRLEAARTGVVAARELLRVSKDRLAKGAAIELEVLDAARVAARAEGRLVAAIVDLDEAQYALLHATGTEPASESR